MSEELLWESSEAAQWWAERITAVQVLAHADKSAQTVKLLEHLHQQYLRYRRVILAQEDRLIRAHGERGPCSAAGVAATSWHELALRLLESFLSQLHIALDLLPENLARDPSTPTAQKAFDPGMCSRHWSTTRDAISKFPALNWQEIAAGIRQERARLKVEHESAERARTAPEKRAGTMSDLSNVDPQVAPGKIVALRSGCIFDEDFRFTDRDLLEAFPRPGIDIEHTAELVGSAWNTERLGLATKIALLDYLWALCQFEMVSLEKCRGTPLPTRKRPGFAATSAVSALWPRMRDAARLAGWTLPVSPKSSDLRTVDDALRVVDTALNWIGERRTELLLSAPGSPEPTATHSTDYRSVNWSGTPYTFTKTQAACVKPLWEAWERGTPELDQPTVLMEADASGNRLVDIFRGHPAWRTLIVSGSTKGSYRLHDSTSQTGRKRRPGAARGRSESEDDLSAYITAKEALEGCPELMPDEQGAYTRLSRLLAKHKEIRTRPHPQHSRRRLVHSADWHRYLRQKEESTFEALHTVTDEQIADAVAAAGERQQQIRRTKQRRGK